MMTAQEYFKRGTDNRAGKTDEAIKDYSEAIKLDPQYADAYFGRGTALWSKKEYTSSIEDLGEAIKLNSGLTQAYIVRGNAWYYKKEYPKALSDYDEAIRLEPDNYVAHMARGYLQSYMNDYGKALEDYSKAIEIKISKQEGYLGRGNLYSEYKKYKGAIQDFSKAIELNSKYAEAYFARGDAHRLLNDDVNALADFRKAVQNDRNIDPGFAILTTYYQYLNPKIQKSIRELSERLWFFDVRSIRDLAREDINNIGKVTHYTKLRIADLLVVPNETRFQYSNAVFMNDPTEGQILVEYLGGKVELLFEKQSEKADNSIYLGSFMQVKDGHEDELIMWRTYGKDENQIEAAGCSFVIDTQFFDKESTNVLPKSALDPTSEEVSPPDNPPNHCLYRVLYYDKRNGNFVKDLEEQGDQILGVVNKFKIDLEMLAKIAELDNSEEEDVRKAIKKIIYFIISEVRYFFKSSDYAFEKEYRVIQYVSPADSLVKFEQKDSPLPRRLYIESTTLLKPFLREIILGPKVPNPDRWLYLDAAMKKYAEDENHKSNFELKHSKHKYQ